MEGERHGERGKIQEQERRTNMRENRGEKQNGKKKWEEEESKNR